jgi:EAL and modified HD-GYP domain-containing signal transduction protein
MATADRVVLEILEEAQPTPELIALLGAVRAEGYTVAIDDFVLGGIHDALLDHVDVVKFELPAVPEGQLAAHIAAVRRPGLTILVEKIETAQQHADALAAGADLFQGYFFARPQIMSARSMASATHTVLALLARLNDPTVGVAELTTLVGTDVTLSQKVMLCVNSGYMSMPRRVSSLHHAVVLLGAERLRQLVTLVLLAGATGKSPELSKLALVRGEMTSELAVGAQGQPPSQMERDCAFTVGLLSTLDAFTDLPLADVAKQLSLNATVYDALIHHTGPCGAALRTTLEYESGADDQDHDPATIAAYVTAVRRADERWAAIAGS